MISCGGKVECNRTEKPCLAPAFLNSNLASLVGTRRSRKVRILVGGEAVALGWTSGVYGSTTLESVDGTVFAEDSGPAELKRKPTWI